LIHFYKRFIKQCLAIQVHLIPVLLVEDIQGLELLKVEDIQGQELHLVLREVDIQGLEVLQVVVNQGDILGQELLQVHQVVDIQELEVGILEQPKVEDIKEVLELLQANTVELLSPKWTQMWPSGSKLLIRTTVATSMLRSLARLLPMEI